VKVSKLAFVVLLVATIVWVIAFYYTLQEHRKYIAWLESEECPIRERLKYLWDGWESAYWRWNGGKYVCLTAPFLLVAWICFIAVAIGKLSERKKPTLTALEACHRPAPSEGQKENKRERVKSYGYLSKMRKIGPRMEVNASHKFQCYNMPHMLSKA
jgi:hypothetical protein